MFMKKIVKKRVEG